MELDTLVAERDIARQIIRFGRAMDDRDWETLASLMFDDVTGEFGAGPLVGSAAIVGNIRTYLDACGPTQHLVGSILVDVDGDTATSRAYVRDMHLGRGAKAGLEFSTIGDYEDRWERDSDGAWRLRTRLKHNRGLLGTLDVFDFGSA